MLLENALTEFIVASGVTFGDLGRGKEDLRRR